jgi:hypothetical protein
MAKKVEQRVIEPIKKKTTIGHSVRSRPKSKQDKRNFKKYRGQG